MSTKARVFEFETFRGQDVSFLSRLRNLNGELTTQASLTSIHVTVTNAAGTKTIDNAAVTVADVIFNTLQGTSDDPDPRWTSDDIGFNFLHSLSGTVAFPARGHYRVEYTFVQADTRHFKLVYEGPARSSNG